MRYLSPVDYANWPIFKQRICFAYNAVSHSSIGDISPFEMDNGLPPNSPFAPPDPHTDADLDDTMSPDTPSPTVITPTLFVNALRTSITAFHRFARSHAAYLQKTTEDRLNDYGTQTHFQVGDKVKFYMPPTHALITFTGRRAKHIVAW